MYLNELDVLPLPQAGEILAPAPAPADAVAPGPLTAAAPGTEPALAPAPAGSEVVSMVQQLNGTGVAPLTPGAAAVLQKVTADLLQDITTGNITVREMPVRGLGLPAPVDFLFLLLSENTGLLDMYPLQTHS